MAQSREQWLNLLKTNYLLSIIYYLCYLKWEKLLKRIGAGIIHFHAFHRENLQNGRLASHALNSQSYTSKIAKQAKT